MKEPNQKLFIVLGTAVMFLGVIFFIGILGILLTFIQEKSDINYKEDAILSRYITTSTPVLEIEESEYIQDSEQDISKQGILKTEENRKVIKLDSKLSDKEKIALEEKYDIEFTNDIDSNGIYVINITEDSDMTSFEEELNANVETDVPIKMFADSVDWGVARIGADKVWDKGTGSGVKIGIIDTGIQKDHPDLAGNIITGYDFVNNDNDANDDNGHGTHVAGIAAASSNNLGVVGVSHSSQLMPIKVLNAQGYGYLSDVAKGVYFATDNGVRVINLSLGSTSDSSLLRDAVNYATNKGVLIIAAAGNDGGAPCSYPAAYSNAVCVVATDSRNLLASFSNIGGELAAPGVYNYSTYIGSTYRYLSGTSMATPHVSGAAALLMSICTTCSSSEIRTLMRDTAVDLGEMGKDILFGYGLIDLTTAVASLQPTPVEETPTEETPTEEQPVTEPTPTKTPKNTKTTLPQIIMILEPVISKGKKYIPTTSSDIDVKYSLSPILDENNVDKIRIYLDNKEIGSSIEQSGIFVVPKDLLNHSQHWVKVVATFKNKTESSAQLLIDMTYLRTNTKTSGKSVLGISFSIFDWLKIF